MALRPTKGDPLDGYRPRENDPAADRPPALRQRMDGMDELEDELATMRGRQDGYRNNLTGFGDPAQDKTLGGNMYGRVPFVVNLISGVEAEDRWRGSDLGGRIVETVPDEMMREGFEIQVQPTEDEDGEREDGFGDFSQTKWDPPQVAKGVQPFPLAQPPAPPDGPKVFDIDDRGAEIVGELEDKLLELNAMDVLGDALRYERAFGGSGVLIGVDDGVDDLTKPLDLKRVKSVQFLAAYRGGWDGELIAWRYYNDPTKPKFGMPEVYMLRNLGVPIASTPAPGETAASARITYPAGPAGGLIFYVHESRLLVFPGRTVSRRVRVQMRGWGESVFTRVEEVLSQYSQTWSAVSNLMQDWAQGVLKIKDLFKQLAAPGGKDGGVVQRRARLLQMSRSIARTLVIDSEEEFKREVAPLTGIGDVLDKFAVRLAAAADMPVTLLMGQAPAGLNATGASDVRFFYDRIAAKQQTNLLPQLRRLVRLMLLAKDGPTGGVEPDRWSVEARPLYQLTASEEADVRVKQATVDEKMIQNQVLTPEEIAASRYGGSKWSSETTIDLKAREKMSKAADRAPVAGAAGPNTANAGLEDTAPSSGQPAPSGGGPAAPAAGGEARQEKIPPTNLAKAEFQPGGSGGIEQPKKDAAQASPEDKFNTMAQGLKTMREAGAVVDVDKLREQFPDLPIEEIVKGD